MSKKKKTIEDTMLSEEERPYNIPENWVWVRMGEVININPSKPKLDLPNEQVCSFLPMSMVNPQTGRIDNLEEREFEKVKKGYTYFKENDVLFAKITPCMENGNTVIAKGLKNEFGFGSTEFYVFRTTEHIDEKYIYYLLRSQKFRNQAKREMTGAVGQQRVPKKFLENYPLALPPFKEQKRIVGKVERLLNEIEEAKQLIEQAKETFALRKAAILDKAFSGTLTAQWRKENFESKSALERLKKIKAERFQVVENKRELSEIQKMFDEIDIEKCIDDNGWLYLKANMFCYNINCGGTPTKDITEDGEIPFLKVYNIVRNKVSFSYKPQYIPRAVHESKLKKSILKTNDVIMNIVGPPLKKIAIIPEQYPEMNMNQAIVRFRPLKFIAPKYLYYCLQYDKTLKEVISETRGVVGQSNISVSQSRNLIMPIPSLEEQSLIVSKLDNLLKREEIALNLINDEENIEQLKQSILYAAFRGELGTNDPSEENAMELLKEVLQEQLK